MDFIVVGVIVLCVWGFARLCGWVFNGPRHRGRRRKRYFRAMTRYLAEDTRRRDIERRLMRDERRGLF